MAEAIQKIRYAQTPDVVIIGINSTPVKYLVHAQQMVAMLTGKNRRASTVVLQNFLQSPDGSRIVKGGDLLKAYQNGAMGAMLYTHYMHNGSSPSNFITLDGVSEILRCLPDQLEGVGRIFEELISALNGSNGDLTSVIGFEEPAIQGDESGVYVLKFQDQANPEYYVGKSKAIHQRLALHTSGLGAACVKGRAFTRVPPVVSGGDSGGDMENWERSEVLELMFRYGINAVRGWKYTLKTMSLEQRLAAFDDVCERFDLCRRCGRRDHFVRDCRVLTTDRWTNGLDVRTMYRMHVSSDERNEQIAEADAKLEEERKARLVAEAKAEAEHEARLAVQRRNAEAIRLLMGQVGDV